MTAEKIQQGNTGKKSDVARLLSQRNLYRKPAFVVKETHFKANVKSRWRKPRGKHSPVRQYHKGRVKMPTVGYGASKAVHGLTRSGHKPILVHRIQDLDLVNSEKNVVVIASNVGARKRLALLQLCLEKKLKVFTIKNVDEEITKQKKSFAARKEASVSKQKGKEAKLKEKKKVKEEKKAAEKKAEAEKKDEKKSETVKSKETKEAKVSSEAKITETKTN